MRVQQPCGTCTEGWRRLDGDAFFASYGVVMEKASCVLFPHRKLEERGAGRRGEEIREGMRRVLIPLKQT